MDVADDPVRDMASFYCLTKLLSGSSQKEDSPMDILM